jgi:hypothetical protein
VRAIFQLVVLGALATPAGAQSLQVFGYAGVLGEWELTATVTEKVSGEAKKFSGLLTMKHVGICTQDGPEEKAGEIRLQMSESSHRISAALLVDGIECSYRGRLSDFYSGVMTCPDRRVVPLKLWLR